MKRKLPPSGLLVAVLAASCGFRELEPLPLSLEFTVDRTTAVVGQEFVFTIDARGDNLIGVFLTYGDGTNSLFEAFGSRTYYRTDRHRYEDPGEYIVTALLEEASSTSVTKAVTLTVTAP